MKRIIHSVFMSKVLSVIMALMLCVSCLPEKIIAEEYGTAEAYFFQGTEVSSVTTLNAASDGSVTFSVSVDPEEGYGGSIGLLSMYSEDGGGDYLLMDENKVYYGASWGGDSDPYLQDATIPDVKAGKYSLKIVNKEKKISIAKDCVTIAAGDSSGKPVISTSSLPTAMVNEPYSFTLSGNNVETYSVAGLPKGLSVNAVTGEISGTPEKEGEYNVTVGASNDKGSVEKKLSLTVEAVRTYTVGFNLGTDFEPIDPITDIEYGKEITLPAIPSKAGYMVDGWYDEKVRAGSPGDSYTVTKDVTLDAKWTEKKGISVSMPTDMKELSGYVWLEGQTGEREARIWSSYYTDPGKPDVIEVPDYEIGEGGFSGLFLKGYIGGRETTIAGYDGSVSAGDSVTLEMKTEFTILKKIEVPGGLKPGEDYNIIYIKDDTGNCLSPYSLPALVKDCEYSVKLEGVRNSDSYILYKWGEQGNLRITADGILKLGEITKLEDSKRISGTVKWDSADGRPGDFLEVCATQKVGNILRTSSVYTDWNGNFKDLAVYPDADAVITVNSGGTLYVSAGKDITVKNDDISGQTIVVKNITLESKITVRSRGDSAAAERYLNATDPSVFLITKNGGTTALTGDFSLDKDSLNKENTYVFNLNSENIDSVSLRGDLISGSAESSVTGSSPGYSAEISAALNPGIVVNLGTSGLTTAFFFAFYDGAGKYLGESGTFYVYNGGRDFGSPCPEGTANVVLVHSSYAGLLGSTDLDSLSGDQKIHSWSVSDMTNGKIEALSSYTATDADSENSMYITKPNSSLIANAESFTDEGEIVQFSGRIALDDGENSSTLTALTLNPRKEELGYTNTCEVKYLVINGERYSVEGSMTGSGIYRLDDLNVRLPADYSIYCVPGSLSYDMDLGVTADIGSRYRGQFIGKATVLRPGASVHILSNHVNSERILVSGVVKYNEEVTIYDNGNPVGKAEADSYGEYSAVVPLSGIDTDGVVTVHRITAVSASGERTTEKTVFHDSDGPELKKLSMSWKDYSSGGEVKTMAVGGAYVFRGAMYGTSFNAEFSNDSALASMEEWDGAKVVFKVYTTDGDVQFLVADGSGGRYSADMGDLSSSVTRTDVLYEPIEKGDECISGEFTASSGFADGLSSISGAYGDQPGSRIEVKFTGDTPAITYKSGSISPENKAKFKKMVEGYHAAGINLLSFSTDDNGDVSKMSTPEWLDRLGKEAGNENKYKGRIFTRTRVFKDKDDFNNAMKHLNKYASDTDTLSVKGGEAYMLYTITDAVENGEELEGGTYLISAGYLNYNGLFCENVSLLFGSGFKGYGLNKINGNTGNLNASVFGASDEAESTTYYDGDNFFYNGSFKAAGEVNKSEKGMQTVENMTGGIADTANAVGDVTKAMIDSGVTKEAIKEANQHSALFGIAASELNTAAMSHNHNTRLGEYSHMDYDIERLMKSPCYDKLTPSQKAIADEAYRDFKEQHEKAVKRDKRTALIAGAVNGVGMGNALFGVVPTGFVASDASNVMDAAGFETVQGNYRKLTATYERSFKTIKGTLYSRGQQLGDLGCKGATTSEQNGDKNKTGNDPSGVVYEAVIENPVEGAYVRLHYAADSEGKIADPEDGDKATEMKEAYDLRNLIPSDPVQVTGADGKYEWGVPKGLWYVTAEGAGLSGDSSADSEAVVSSSLEISGMPVEKLLPVLPIQVDVNIPFTDYTAPLVDEVKYTTNGIYVTYSKYMMEKGEGSVLDSGKYSLILTGSDPASREDLVISEITGYVRGHAPKNIDPEETTYSKTVLIKVKKELKEGMVIEIKTDKSVQSYAGISMRDDYSGSGTVIYEKPEDEGSDTGVSPAPDDGFRTSEIIVNGDKYMVRWTGTVSFNGTKHVETGGKGGKKTKDISIEVTRNGTDISSSSYKADFKNNVYVNGYKGKGSPFFILKFRGKGQKQVNKVFKKNKFEFEIKPAEISDTNVIYKKISLKSGTVKIKGLKYTGGVRNVKMKAAKGNKGDYRAESAENIVIIHGVNNYTGEARIKTQ